MITHAFVAPRKSKLTAKQRANKAASDALAKKWGIDPDQKKKSTFVPLKSYLKVPLNQSTAHIPSRDSGAGSTPKKPVAVYTGDKMLGITVLHKSCLQPVFSSQEAIDAATMRR